MNAAYKNTPRYTVAEIDALRGAMREKYPRFGTELVHGEFNHVMQIQEPEPLFEYTARIEELVRTHMIAGHRAADIDAETPRDPYGNTGFDNVAVGAKSLGLSSQGD